MEAPYPYTMLALKSAHALLHDALAGGVPAAQAVVRWRGEVIWSYAGGWLDPEAQQQPAAPDTLFDLASLTKLFATTAFMRLVEAGRLALDQPIGSILSGFDGPRPIQPYEDPLRPGAFVTLDTLPEGMVAAGQITFRQLLAHHAGLPAWLPLYREPDRDAALVQALSTPFAYRPGTRCVYSDIGLLLLGLAIEEITGQQLNAVVYEQITEPLGLAHTAYRPHGAVSGGVSVAPTEYCAWRNRRLRGEVHDENAWSLGGISAHAGLFSTASDVARFGQVFLDSGRPLLGCETVAEMVRLQAEEGAVRRGLGFALWSPDPDSSGHPFSPSAFGHTGFTGTSLWIDPERSLVVALLTNEVYRGRQARVIGPLRIAFHRAVVQAIDAQP